MSATGAIDVAAELPDWCLHTGEEPMPETSLHYYFSALIVSAIRWIFRDRNDVFVAANFAWFPVANDSRDPDVMVAFGRPNHPRSSWRNEREEGVAPSVVFEMKSKSNTRAQISAKRAWYDQHGVSEYYEYDPDQGTFRAWLRNETGKLEAVLPGTGMLSPALGIRFVLNGPTLELVGPDGRVLGDYVSAEAAAEAERDRAEAERERADAAVAELAALRAAIAEGTA